MKQVKVNFDKTTGTIKPMHGVGQPPILGNEYHMFDYLKEAKIPYSRLHDVGGDYGGNRYVDIPNLFRDFDADPYDPESYDFAFTDLLVTNLVERGIEPFFRLGVTIENYARIKAYRIYPPKDNLKWAQICEGVIRHYTEGWANGFHYDIEYWEIWNEPDNQEEIMINEMWRGTKEQYYELYGVVSKYLKEKFPHLKIGGYASCGFYAILEEKTVIAEAKSSSRTEYFLEFFEGFLQYVKKHHCPLDFFSWHSYSSIEDNVKFATYARKRLDEEGFADTEHTLNEWNCKPLLKGTLEHAALTCSMMLALQNTSLDSAMFYDARCDMGNYSGMFHPMTYKPHPAYYGFLAFSELYCRKNQTEVIMDIPGVYACAAKGDTACLVIANTNAQDVDVSVEVTKGYDVTKCMLIAKNSIWKKCSLPASLPKHSVICVYYNECK